MGCAAGSGDDGENGEKVDSVFLLKKGFELVDGAGLTTFSTLLTAGGGA